MNPRPPAYEAGELTVCSTPLSEILVGVTGLCQQHPANRLGYLRDDGVSERLKSSHPAGNPISHATHSGFNRPVSSKATSPAKFLKSVVAEYLSGDGVPALPRFAVGVGQLRDDEDSLSEVRGTDRGSRYSLPFRVIPAFHQACDDIGKPSPYKPGHVLHEDVAGSKQPNNSGELGPDPSWICLCASSSSVTNRLARESSAEKIDRLNCSVEGSDVVVAANSGPVVGEDSAAEAVLLALPDDPHPGAFKSEVESADAGEK